MTSSITQTSANQGSALRSTGAILLGFVAVVVLSLGTDQIFHSLKVYPPWDQPMHEPGLNLLALSYRIVYTVLGSYIAARLAPRNPMRHAMILGFIGFPIAVAGAIAAIKMNLGPAWYPIMLAVTTLPCAWLGGVLYRTTKEEKLSTSTVS
jgi:hypothetical protein